MHMEQAWWIMVLQALVAGIVAGFIIQALQVIWEIRKDYLILRDKVEELEKKLNEK